jgi:hypothetical protein
MWTLTNQWDLQRTTEIRDRQYEPVPETATWYFSNAGEPIWATTRISAIKVHDNDGDFATIHFTGYKDLQPDGSGVRNFQFDFHRFNNRVAIGSETMLSLSYEADSRNIAARGIVSVQFWQKS